MDTFPALKTLYTKYLDEHEQPPKNASQFQAFGKEKGVSLQYKIYAQFLRNPTGANVDNIAAPKVNAKKKRIKSRSKKRGKKPTKCHFPNQYLYPKQVADVIRKVIIPKLKTVDPKSHEFLNQKKHQQLIESVLCEHDVDSFQVDRIAAITFAGRMQEAAGTKKIHFPASVMWKSLQKEIKEMDASLQWKHIVNAVRHEMTKQIAEKVAAVMSTLGPLGVSTGDALVFAINSKTERILTDSEAKYLRSLIVRATEKITLNAIEKSKSSSSDFDMSMELMRDVLNTHKVFIFGSFNCSQYTLNEFHKDLKMAEKNIFGEAICTPYITSKRGTISNKKLKSRATMYPSWVIRDDLFQVFRYHFAVSHWVSRLKLKDIGEALDVLCCVIPEDVMSLYDPNVKYQHSFQNVKEYLAGTDVEVVHHSKFQANQLDVVDIVQRIDDSVKSTDIKSSKTIVLVVDRRNSRGSENDSYYVLRCDSMADVIDLTTNHFIGLHFDIRRSDIGVGDANKYDEKLVKCWLRYGNRQRLRFWPEQLIWFIPRLFVKGKQSGYKFAKKLHSDDYKHGFCVDLKDPVFERYYKILTSWTHQSVNYRRSEWAKTRGTRFGFRDHIEDQLQGEMIMKTTSCWIEHEYSTDDILDDLSGPINTESSNIINILSQKDDSQNASLIERLIQLVAEYEKTGSERMCSKKHPSELWRCQHAQRMVRRLIEFQRANYEVDAGNVVQFDEKEIIYGLDHLADVHGLICTENRKRVQKYFIERVHCDMGSECNAPKHLCSRRREISDGDGQNDGVLDEAESVLELTRGAISSAHCYLLHSDETLYRMSGQSTKFEMNPFSTPVVEPENEEKKEDEAAAPPSIDFGVHALQWLPYGVQPLFESFIEELVNNPVSTLSPELLELHRVECAAKLDGIQWTVDNFDELLCLKLYSDCTELQNLFRKAYWKSASLETKRSFYQWAIKMYQTFLYHAQPIEKSGGGPQTLYHGLDKLFQIQATTPTYQGPFSTTTSIIVAYDFAGEEGLIFSVKGSYSNPMHVILGIDMVRISCFKHEQEVLLYSQTLPIKSTEALIEDDEKLVDHLMFSLKSTKEPITNKDVFFQKIGLRMKSEWILPIAVHPMLEQKTAYTPKGREQWTVLDRLRQEIGMLQDLEYVELCRQRDRIVFTGSAFRLKELWDLSEWIFSVSVNGKADDNEYKFEKKLCGKDFCIPVTAHSINSDLDDKVALMVQRSGKSNNALPLWNITYEYPFARYNLDREEALRIGHMMTVRPFDEFEDNGTIQIQCNSSINVSSEGGINTDGAGLRAFDVRKCYEQYVTRKVSDREVYQEGQHLMLSFGTFIGSKERVKYKWSAAGAGGGIIALGSAADVANDGILSSTGSAEDGFGGGTICLCTCGKVVNRGQIECRPNGRIIVDCRQFVNEGVINPVPTILITDGTKQKDLEILRMPWCQSVDKWKEIPLSIYEYRGHFEEYHPRNLLDKNGTETSYVGDDGAVGDWIIFEMESLNTGIPMAVTIRNDDGEYGSGLNSFSLSLSTDGDNFQKFAVVQDVHNDNNEKQYLVLKDVKLRNVNMWMKNYRFIKLKVLSNWGDDENKFYSFAVFAVEGK